MQTAFFNSLTDKEKFAYWYSDWLHKDNNAELVEWFEANRLEVAVQMYKEEKVSIERGAIIAGMPLRDFMKTLSERKISIIEG